MSSLAATVQASGSVPLGAAVASYTEDWILIQQALKSKLGEATFKSWVKPITLHEFTSGTLILGAPTRFIRDWVRTNFLDDILATCREQNAKILAVDIIVDPKAAVAAADSKVSSGNQVDYSRTSSTTYSNRQGQGLEKVEAATVVTALGDSIIHAMEKLPYGGNSIAGGGIKVAK